jgi:hypothetical protein
MNGPKYPHDLDLGAPVETDAFDVMLQSQAHSELFRGVLQAMRNQAAMLERVGRQTPKDGNPLEFRAYHAGGADALEELLMSLYAIAYPDRVSWHPSKRGDEDS